MKKYIAKKISTILWVFLMLWSGINTGYAQTQEAECHEVPAFTPENESEWLEALAEELNKRGFVCLHS